MEKVAERTLIPGSNPEQKAMLAIGWQFLHSSLVSVR
jgi:hypothetical protein